MLSASEALEITKEYSRFNHELKRIEPYIKAKAMEGEYKAIIYPCIQLHSKTIETLKQLGYKITSYFDTERRMFTYCIEWGDEEKSDNCFFKQQEVTYI